METGSSYRSFSCLFAMSVLWSKRVSLACRASRGSVARQAVARRTGRRVRHGDAPKKEVLAVAEEGEQEEQGQERWGERCEHTGRVSIGDREWQR